MKILRARYMDGFGLYILSLLSKSLSKYFTDAVCHCVSYSFVEKPQA